MKKILIVSILAIAMLFACVGCNFGVAPVNYSKGASPQPQSSATSDASSTSNPSATSTASSTVTPGPSSGTPSVTPSAQPTTPTWKTMDPTVYTPAFVLHDTSNAMDVQINLQNGATSVNSIQLDSQTPNNWNFAYESGILKVPQDFLAAKGTGKFTLRANTNSGAVDCTLYVATKVITTCQEFQNIGTSNMPLTGTYVLGNDLDFSTFGNFNPIGNTGLVYGTKTGLDFTGIFCGAGHTISNLTADADLMEDNDGTNPGGIHTEYNVDVGYTIPKLRSCFGIFMRNSGTICDVCFKDCLVNNTVGTVMGMVAAVNEKKIENVIVDGGSVIGGDIWLDFNCYVAGFAGMNGAGGSINNCICALDSIEGNGTHTLVRAFVGKTWGPITNCYAQEITSYTFFDIEMGTQYGEFIDHAGVYSSDPGDPNLTEKTGYGFTYLATDDRLQKADNLYGIVATASFTNSGIKTSAQLNAGTTADLYANYSTDIWTISGTAMPQLNVLYTKA